MAIWMVRIAMLTVILVMNSHRKLYYVHRKLYYVQHVFVHKKNCGHVFTN